MPHSIQGSFAKKLKSRIWFTLVELIVVITILVILGTIALLSVGIYSKNAKDGGRIADIGSIVKALELLKIKTGYYPDPTGPFDVSYSGAIAWSQWSVGDSVIRMLGKISTKPVDPLTKNEYAYSVTNMKNEFQIGAIYENYTSLVAPGLFVSDSFVNEAHAGVGTMKAMVRGNYNGKFVKTNSGSTTYILGAPSILTSEITSVDMQSVMANKSFIFEGYENIPSQYGPSGYTLTGGFSFSGTGNVLLEGDINTLATNSGKLLFAEKLDAYYSDTIISWNQSYQEVVDIDTTANSTGAIQLITNYLNNNMGGIVGRSLSNTTVAATSSGSSGTGTVGACGADSGKHLYITPTRLCDAWTPSLVADGGILSDYTWTCQWESPANCSGRHAFGWTYTPADIKNLFSDYSIYTENWSANTCNPATMSVVDLSPGTNTIPTTLANNTIYRLAAGDYINSNTINDGGAITSVMFGSCSALIGVGNVTFYTSTKVNHVFTMSDNTIIAWIKMDGLNNGVGGTHASSQRNDYGISFWDNNTIHNSELYNLASAVGWQHYNAYLHNMKIYNNTSALDLGAALHSVFMNIDFYNNSSYIYMDGGENNIYSNIKSYNNQSAGIRFWYDGHSSMTNVLTFNNNSDGIAFETYPGVVSNIYSFSNNGSNGIRSYIYDIMDGSPNSIFHNLFSYNNKTGMSLSNGDTNTYLFGSIKSFGNSVSDFAGWTIPFGSGSSLGFTDGSTLDTSGTFSTNWVAIPSTAGWNHATKGPQALTFTGGTTYTYGSSIGNQLRPIKYNIDSGLPEPWWVDGIHYDSTKKVGEW